METWRTIALVLILTLCLIDLSLTYYYVQKYKYWQPQKPYKLIELNPLLRFLWNNLGLIFGTIVGAVIIFTLNYLVAKSGHWIIVSLLLLFLCWAIYNHTNNINLLHQLIEKYPSGYLPVETSGEVVGNNIK